MFPQKVYSSLGKRPRSPQSRPCTCWLVRHLPSSHSYSWGPPSPSLRPAQQPAQGVSRQSGIERNPSLGQGKTQERLDKLRKGSWAPASPTAGPQPGRSVEMWEFGRGGAACTSQAGIANVEDPHLQTTSTLSCPRQPGQNRSSHCWGWERGREQGKGVQEGRAPPAGSQ
ncbi:unnamed protein product [Rangifer tarandus platyrhynchus]|uniref:Uncharacterized protein n=1 Tax=Rangifer tarandus platyrhynchus TaxID=3082113 RepID=A0ABN8YXL0_RANTA|nr:unnamed protein product [Rangifer tarandus platyrhynchus]